MKNKMIILSTLALLLAGCTGNDNVSSSDSSSSSNTNLQTYDGNAYEAFEKSMNEVPSVNSYSAGAQISYRMSYSDDTQDIFILDEVLKADQLDKNPTAQLSQNIESNGMQISTSGNYYDGTLYNSYNGITYYEDMNFSDLKQATLIPLDPVQYTEDQIESITAAQTADGSFVYTIVLKQDFAAELFSDRYDSYGVSDYDDYEITGNQIIDTFDANGYFISEKAVFEISLSYSGYEVGIDFESSVEYINVNETTIEIDEDTRKTESEYVAYTNIDTGSMSTEVIDDAAEDTIEETFKKRLINRLGYEISDEGQYQVSYNDAEAYIIDFTNKTFIYSNYSIRYSYNWKGDVGSLGACTLDFKTNASSTSCEESTLEMIRTVKSYLQMELYYCGLSLDDLQAEVN